MSFYLLSSLCISVLPLSQVINEDCNGLLEKAQRGDFSTGMPRQGQVNILVFEYQAGPGEYLDQFFDRPLWTLEINPQKNVSFVLGKYHSHMTFPFTLTKLLLPGGHHGGRPPLSGVQPAQHLQGEGVQQVQEQPDLHIPQLLRLLQAQVLHPGEREEPGGERGGDGVEVDLGFLGEDGLPGRLQRSSGRPLWGLSGKNKVMETMITVMRLSSKDFLRQGDG